MNDEVKMIWNEADKAHVRLRKTIHNSRYFETKASRTQVYTVTTTSNCSVDVSNNVAN
jgi:hypothetical protein